MNLATLAAEAVARNRPIRVGLIGAGKFGSMFLSQAPTIAGIEVTAIAELEHARMVAACTAVGDGNCASNGECGLLYLQRGAAPFVCDCIQYDTRLSGAHD